MSTENQGATDPIAQLARLNLNGKVGLMDALEAWAVEGVEAKIDRCDPFAADAPSAAQTPRETLNKSTQTTASAL